MPEFRSTGFGGPVGIAVLIAFIAAASIGCGGGGSNPSAVAGPSTTPASTTATISGQVVSLNGGAPVAGVAIAAGTVTTTSDAQGMFTASLPTGATTERFVLTAPQILSRTVFLTRTTRNVRLDVIRTDDGGFDPPYYRQLVRNELGSTTGLHPIRRWTRSPSFYLRTIDEGGNTVTPSILDALEADIRLMIPAYTAGQFDVAAIERGTQTRETTAGWVTVKFAAEPEPGVCGRAHVGLELGGTITLFYTHASGCACDGSPVGHRLMRHELGHSMGFWHTSRREDVMFPTNIDCHGMPSSRELFHASIAYARPVGNMDPDTDPSTSIRVLPAMISN
jgi:hypothetical protein